ncbi:recombination protein RecR [Denitrovibrio acetiphilus DSM 12809]|uniref:Recombination protein RecR n=1 Tax=Denitrovibrio acetiphilus (strain DSM 12809 / NBRC 114555 / N2460) TaxID=522772 RepID=D4H3N1_DENA2|nr:recombination mediator RecR [Denitrovibrio acetiphilus]ADD69133.1 recombination protein RecR [Denitrovibrio acetiphilus DSM 12809]
MKNRIFERCVGELSRLPGIGRKTAARLALHILKADSEQVKSLAESLVELKEKTVFCKICGNMSETEVCHICTDGYRNRSQICVVEEAKDIYVLEATGFFRGLYHVLGGRISPLDGIGPEDLHIEELLKRAKAEDVSEIILATNPDIEGETTAIYLSKLLKKQNLKVTKIASGVPIGTNLEYTDEITLLKAMEQRKDF